MKSVGASKFFNNIHHLNDLFDNLSVMVSRLDFSQEVISLYLFIVCIFVYIVYIVFIFILFLFLFLFLFIFLFLFFNKTLPNHKQTFEKAIK